MFLKKYFKASLSCHSTSTEKQIKAGGRSPSFLNYFSYKFNKGYFFKGVCPFNFFFKNVVISPKFLAIGFFDFLSVTSSSLVLFAQVVVGIRRS